MNQLEDKNIKSYKEIITPKELKNQLPINKKISKFILQKRKEIQDILDKKSKRKLIIVGPCSIHNTKEALEYSKKIKNLQEKVKDKFLILMRTYFEKPRTTIGWKGLIYDPDLNNSNKIKKGLQKSRKLLLEIAELNIGTATEFLGPMTPQYLDDLISWVAIGARNSESQPHRELASGLSTPVGFKNDTSGNFNIAINSVKAASNTHSFIGTNRQGKNTIVNTQGNKYCHIILRGGIKNKKYISNYKKKTINKVEKELEKQKIPKNILIDCSHANSEKDIKKQSKVFNNVIKQIKNNSIIGLMLESNLNQGKQKISNNLKKGISITDACLSWKTTENLILKAYKKLK